MVDAYDLVSADGEHVLRVVSGVVHRLVYPQLGVEDVLSHWDVGYVEPQFATPFVPHANAVMVCKERRVICLFCRKYVCWVNTEKARNFRLIEECFKVSRISRLYHDAECEVRFFDGSISKWFDYKKIFSINGLEINLCCRMLWYSSGNFNDRDR